MTVAIPPSIVQTIDNRIVARIAKLAGAPADKAAGVMMGVRLGDHVQHGDILLTVHAESPGELEYALEFERSQTNLVLLGE